MEETMNRREELYIVIGLFIAGCGCLAAWLAVPQLRDLFSKSTSTVAIETPDQINNPLAESDGIIWKAVFYGNKELKNPSVLEKEIQGAQNGLRVDWGINSPDPDMQQKDYFSAKFTTSYHFLAGQYCFVIEVDDGAKLLIDGSEIRSFWWGHTLGATYKTAVPLDEGSHLIEFEYYEEREKAFFHIFWYKDAGPECVTVGHPGVP